MAQERDLATVASVTFEHGIVIWAGRKYEPWVRAWAHPHPLDPKGMVQLPEPIFQAFQERLPGERLNKHTASALGYPHVPGEQELTTVRNELHEALGRCDWDYAHDLDAEMRDLETRVAVNRVTALRPHPAFGH